jgi:hypothetical protein
VDAKQPVLIMIQGPEPGSIYKLPDNRVTTIGRSSRNTIRVVTASVSRFHCEIACVNGVWELSDLNSRKGTMLNGQRVRDRATIGPGDVVRVSTSIFRFDRVSEVAGNTEAITAIKEAELDLRLRPKGEATATLAEIQVRSRLEGQRGRRDRSVARQAQRAGTVFLVIVTCAVTVAAAGVLLYGHLRAQAEADSNAATARAALDQAVATAQSGQTQEAIRILREIQTAHPGTELAADAARKCLEVQWSAVQQSLPRVARSEAGRDHAGALAVYDELLALAPSEQIQFLLQRRQAYTVRLAHAAFRALQQTAREHIDSGDLDAALKLYRWAMEHAGVAELVTTAREEAAKLEKRTLR